MADPAWDAENECYTKPPLAGMRTFGSIYAGWGLSPEFYREEEFLNEETGCVSLDDFLEDYIESFSEYVVCISRFSSRRSQARVTLLALPWIH